MDRLILMFHAAGTDGQVRLVIDGETAGVVPRTGSGEIRRYQACKPQRCQAAIDSRRSRA